MSKLEMRMRKLTWTNWLLILLWTTAAAPNIMSSSCQTHVLCDWRGMLPSYHCYHFLNHSQYNQQFNHCLGVNHESGFKKYVTHL